MIFPSCMGIFDILGVDIRAPKRYKRLIIIFIINSVLLKSTYALKSGEETYKNKKRFMKVSENSEKAERNPEEKEEKKNRKSIEF